MIQNIDVQNGYNQIAPNATNQFRTMGFDFCREASQNEGVSFDIGLLELEWMPR